MFFMSSDFGSAKNTAPAMHSLLRKFLPWLANQLSPEMVDRIDFNIRKTAHVTEYTILSILLFRALTRGREQFRNGYVIGTVLLSIGWAASDEYHQSFVPSRWASAADVFFDAAGVLLGTMLCLWRWLWRTQNPTKESG